jgi:hypothetical protein
MSALLALAVRADDITLRNGTVFKNARITHSDAARVTIAHESGIARVMIQELPPELRAQYKYDPERARQLLVAEHQASIDRKKQQQGSAAYDRLTAGVDELVRKGLLRVDTEGRQAWVDPGAWFGVDAETKENLSKAIGFYCSAEYPSVDIFDKQSGRKIASYGPFQGFRAY